MKLDVINLEGKKVGDIELAASVFELPERKDLLHRVVNWQLANARQGSANTRHRSDINRTTKKLYRQKGTGGARHGSKRSNIFVGGATQFGPKPKEWAFNLNRKVRQLALRVALSVKAARQELIILDEAKLKTHKTKDLSNKLQKMDALAATVVVDSMETNFDRASGNLPHIKVLPTEGLNVYDILRQPKLILTQDAVKLIEARLGNDKSDSESESKSENAPAKPAATKAAAKADAPKAAAKPAAKKSTGSAAKKPAAKTSTKKVAAPATKKAAAKKEAE